MTYQCKLHCNWLVHDIVPDIVPNKKGPTLYYWFFCPGNCWKAVGRPNVCHWYSSAKASEFSVDQGYAISLSCSIVQVGIPGKNSWQMHTDLHWQSGTSCLGIAGPATVTKLALAEWIGVNRCYDLAIPPDLSPKEINVAQQQGWIQSLLADSLASPTATFAHSYSAASSGSGTCHLFQNKNPKTPSTWTYPI